MDTNTIKNDLIKLLNRMISEFELSFEYIPKDNIKKIYKYLNKLKSDNKFFKNEVENIYNILSQYSDEISNIKLNETKQKIKQKELQFLSNIKLFNNLLDYKIFENENKNTKRSIIKYLYEINLYTMLIYSFEEKGNIDVEEIFKKLNIGLKLNTNDTKNVNENSGENIIQGLDKILPGLTNNINVNAFDDVIKNMMADKNMMSIVNDLTNDIQKSHTNPMSLLTSMLSGKPNHQITSMVKKIEKKIQTGELNTNTIMKQADNFSNIFKK